MAIQAAPDNIDDGAAEAPKTSRGEAVKPIGDQLKLLPVRSRLCRSVVVTYLPVGKTEESGKSGILEITLFVSREGPLCGF